MSNATGSIMSHPHPTLIDRAAAWASWGLAGAIFLTVGWLAMAPDDPQGAVSILTRTRPMAMLLQAGGLAGVTAALATVLAGRRLPHIGTFAAALGLAAVSLRGESAVYLLLQRPDTTPQASSALAGKLAGEVLLWSGVIAIAVATTEIVARWLTPTAPRGASVQGWRHAGVATASGLVVFYILGGGVTARAIEHGQACFLVAATVCLAVYLAHRLAPTRTPLPSLAAVGALAVAGYAWAWLRPSGAGLPANIPASPFLRVLPIQFISVGAAAAVAMHWYVQSHGHAGDRDDATDEHYEDVH